MNKIIVLTAVFLVSLFLIVACTPSQTEPEAADRIASRTPEPPPIGITETPILPLPTAASALIELPLKPEDAPAALPIYQINPEPIPSDEESALAWAQSFGLPNGEIMAGDPEAIRILSLDETGNFYEELTFVNQENNRVIIYSSGIYWQNFNGPTPTPEIETLPVLPQEMVTEAALSFVREHHLLPEPIIAHELPTYDGDYYVFVSFALEGLRITGVGQEPGVTIRIDGNGRLAEARIVPGNFSAVESKAVQPLDQLYGAFLGGAVQSVFFYERGQSGESLVDPMRFQAHSLLYGERGDRVELVYASLPMESQRLTPMWLITRPHDDSWTLFGEYYLLAVGGENTLPPPRPTPTPLAQVNATPQSLTIVPPIIVDGANGRLYTNAVVDNIVHTVSLDAATGELLAVFGLTGDLALDAERNLLYVDKYPHGLTVIDTTTGEAVNDISVPTGEKGYARLQADPASGNVLLFRDQMALVADPLSPTWQRTVPFMVEATACGQPAETPEPSAISQTWFDQTARLLYLALADDVCEAAISYTVIVYDMSAMSEIARYSGLDFMHGTAVNGRFYGKSWIPPHPAYLWAWQEGLPWFEQTEREPDFAASSSDFQVDQNRGWLYEMTNNGLQILDMETLAVALTLASPVNGRLAAFDPVTDNLYFVETESEQLFVWSAENIQN